MKQIQGRFLLQSNKDFPADCEMLDYMQTNAHVVSIIGNLAGDKAILLGCALTGGGTQRNEGYVFLRTKEHPEGVSPEKTVILPKKRATCPMAEQITPARVRAFREENPEVTVVAYINTTAALKAECDVCVTSSSAVNKILFIPDRNLGAWVRKQCPEKEILLWDGYCPIHNSITQQDVLRAKAQHPSAKLAMHPECPPEALQHADMIGATSAIIDYALQNEQEDILFGTECGVYNDLIQKYPRRHFYQLRGDKLICPDMKTTSLQDVYMAITEAGGEEIVLEEPLRKAAKRSLDNMLKYGG